MLFQVITSWQVIAVSVGVILYFFLVSYVARFNHQHRTPRSVNATKSKNVSSAPAITSDEEIDTNDELGLEE